MKMKRDNTMQFWDKTAGMYNKFVYHGGNASKAYENMINDICKYLNQNMDVLELAAGPGILSHRLERVYPS